MEIGSNMLGNLSEFAGGISKGVLVVRKVGKITPKGVAGDKQSKNGSQNRRNRISEKATTDIFNLAKSQLSKTSDGAVIGRSGGGKMDRDTVAETLGNAYTAMEVQYNPRSLSFNTMNGDKYFFNRPGMGSEGANILAKWQIPSQTTLSITLILEEINPANVFMWESEQLTGGFSTAGSAVNSVSSIKNKWNGEKGTLRKKAEALLALLLSPATRDVFFIYSGTLFHGNLTKVKVDYKMFDKEGEPVLAEVLINIAQSDKFVQDTERWEKLFSDYFDSAEEPDAADAAEPGVDDILDDIGPLIP